jgi:hypothetical protein
MEIIRLLGSDFLSLASVALPVLYGALLLAAVFCVISFGVANALERITNPLLSQLASRRHFANRLCSRLAFAAFFLMPLVRPAAFISLGFGSLILVTAMAIPEKAGRFAGMEGFVASGLMLLATMCGMADGHRPTGLDVGLPAAYGYVAGAVIVLRLVSLILQVMLEELADMQSVEYEGGSLR